MLKQIATKEVEWTYMIENCGVGCKKGVSAYFYILRYWGSKFSVNDNFVI